MANEVVTRTAFSEFMEKFKPQMALALPKHLNVDRMVRLALTAFSTSPKLRECSMESIAASIMTAAQLGHEPGVNGAGFLVPYNSKKGKICTYVPGWKGLVDLVSRSGRGTVYSGVIFSDQKYTFVDGSRRELIIHNETDLDDPTEITHAFSVGWVKGSDMPIIELWRVGKIKKHRDKYNKVGSDHYSFRDWEMYARKVPLLQVLKYMPSSIEIANAIAISNASEAGHRSVIEDGIVIDLDSERERERNENGKKLFEHISTLEGKAVETAFDEPQIEAVLQAVYKSLTDYGAEIGETPDDLLARFTSGKVTALIDLEDKPVHYLKDILLMIITEKEAK
jgi:recombination protein RecT